MNDMFEKYFLNITQEDENMMKIILRKVRTNTNYVLRCECKRLINKGY